MGGTLMSLSFCLYIINANNDAIYFSNTVDTADDWL